MGGKKPDVKRMKKKRRVEELVAALRYDDPRTRVDVASALGEIGDRRSAESMWEFARELTASAAGKGDWDPAGAARPVLKAWAEGASRNPDPALRDAGARVLPAIVVQEQARVNALLGTTDLHDLDLALPGLELPEPPAPVERPVEPPPTLEPEPEQPETSTPPVPVPDTLEAGPAAAAAQPAFILRGHEAEICELRIAEGRVFSGAWDGTVRVWDLVDGHSIHVLPGHGHGHAGVRVSSDGRRIVTTSPDGSLRVWDAVDGRRLHTLEGHRDHLTALALAPDGRRAVSGSADTTLRVWDLETAESLLTLTGHTGAITALQTTPDGDSVISGSQDATVRIWDLTSGDLLRTMIGYEWEALHAVFAGGTRVLTYGGSSVPGDREGTWRVRDASTGSILRAYREGQRVYPDTTAAVTPADDWAILPDHEGGLVMWDLISEDAAHTVERHAGDVVAIAVTPDGRWVISGSTDATIRIWDVTTQACLHVLEGHVSIVTALAVTPDGRLLVSGSSDSSLMVWDLAAL